MIEVNIKVKNPPLCPFCGEPLAVIKCTEDYQLEWNVRKRVYEIPDSSRDIYPLTCAACGNSSQEIIDLLFS